MPKCAIYDDRSLNFFRGTCGFLTLLAFLVQNIWLILIVGLLFLLGAFSMNLNFLYTFFSFFSGSVLKKEMAVVSKDPNELRFVYAFTAILYLASFALLYFNKFTAFAWGLELTVSFLTLLATFADVCVAALMYILFKRLFEKHA